MEGQIARGDLATLPHFQTLGRVAQWAHPTHEHYLPLLYAVGSRLPGDEVGVFNDTIDGALSMTSYLIGDPALLKTVH